MTFKRMAALWMSRAPEEHWKGLNKSLCESQDGQSTKVTTKRNGAATDYDKNNGSPEESYVLHTAISQDSDEDPYRQQAVHTDNEMISGSMV